MGSSSKGYVYLLKSDRSEYIKIGGTDFPPLKRIREINTTGPYKSLGPWKLVDFRQVADWRKVESTLHYTFRSKLNKDITGQKELFDVPLQVASRQLNKIDVSLIIDKPKVDRMFQDEDFFDYLLQLFKFTGLLNWLDIQGAWTFVLFPLTNGGRYFTINIGTHEVAFCSLPVENKKFWHMILVDSLINEFPGTIRWIKKHKGDLEEDVYASARPRATSIRFLGEFADAKEFFELDGVRRALIAYWSEALTILNERNVLSSYSRYHNWNAIAKINSVVNSR